MGKSIMLRLLYCVLKVTCLSFGKSLCDNKGKAAYI
uniref:Uncharacterized protein n=1 Tax=Rhizophora mucronata TaxID=61149 RepID=A0A2P2NE67_RHIMU